MPTEREIHVGQYRDDKLKYNYSEYPPFFVSIYAL